MNLIKYDTIPLGVKNDPIWTLFSDYRKNVYDFFADKMNITGFKISEKMISAYMLNRVFPDLKTKVSIFLQYRGNTAFERAVRVIGVKLDVERKYYTKLYNELFQILIDTWKVSGKEFMEAYRKEREVDYEKIGAALKNSEEHLSFDRPPAIYDNKKFL